MEGSTRIFALICAVMFNSLQISVCETNDAPKIPKIVIIGAGPAGIATASKLFENGFTNVTILEAEDRIGGRIYTTKFGNYSVDLGGQWIHGEGENVAYKLASSLGLLDKSEKFNFALEQQFVDSQGNPLSSELSRKLVNFLIKYVYNEDFENNTTYQSIGEYSEKMFIEQFKDNPEVLNEKKKYLHHLELTRMSSDSAESWYDISTADSKLYREYPGDQLVNWKERGYSTILDILMKHYPLPENELPVINNTILNTEVTSIDYSNDAEGPAILITTANGGLYKANHVIVTVSIGVLKEKHKSLFIPSLPDYKVAAIDGIGFGCVAKIYLLFDKPFWELGDWRILHFSLMWNDIDRSSIEADPDKNWLLGIVGVMTVEHKPNLLTLWITGKYVRAMEAISEDKVFKHAVENLHRFLDKKYNVSEPVAMLRTRWCSNRHFKGTYSYRSIEAHKRQVFPEMLERPLTPQNLTILFAGEATSNDRYSTVDGAIGSGWKAADRLINHYKSSTITSA